MRKSNILYPILFCLFSSSAMAAVTFDVKSGTGFIGKGDLSLLYGWNNKQYQDNVGKANFNSTGNFKTTYECLEMNGTEPILDRKGDPDLPPKAGPILG
jgi:hypothetical protein